VSTIPENLENVVNVPGFPTDRKALSVARYKGLCANLDQLPYGSAAKMTKGIWLPMRPPSCRHPVLAAGSQAAGFITLPTEASAARVSSSGWMTSTRAPPPRSVSTAASSETMRIVGPPGGARESSLYRSRWPRPYCRRNRTAVNIVVTLKQGMRPAEESGGGDYSIHQIDSTIAVEGLSLARFRIVGGNQQPLFGEERVSTIRNPTTFAEWRFASTDFSSQ